MADRLAPSKRHEFIHEESVETQLGRLIYEWDQTFEEVNIYVPVPPGVRAKDIFCNISASHVQFGIRPNPPYLDQDLAGPVKASECVWMLEDGTLHLTLQKLQKGEPWGSAVQGQALDPLTQQADQQRLMLERFQQENPGFDFSGATFNGQVPNPRTFMKDQE